VSLACTIRLNTALTPAQRALYQDPETIRALLASARTIALVGLSADPQKASFFVASYLLDAGYRVVPVNPRGGLVLGQKVFKTLAEIPEPVDIVDVFRPAAEAPELARQAVAIGAKALWLQLRVISLEAGEIARSAGLIVVQDACVKMEHGRHSGGLHSAGMNTELISARRPALGARL
jgi:predicted CoA-binding protein